MLKFFTIKYSIYNNGILVDKNYSNFLSTEEEVKEKVKQDIVINWDNLKKEYEEHGLLLPFNYWNLKKGRVISFFNGGFTDKNRRDIKEWKKELNIVIKKEYEEFTPDNIEYVLKWYEIEKAIQYLKQQGIDRI